MPAIIAAAVTMSALFGFASTITVNAEELTQATDASTVNYGNYGADIAEKDIEMLKGMFDAEYYLSQNSDLWVLINENFAGYSSSDEQIKEFVFKHFCTFGLYEGRSLNSEFNVSVFATVNADLKASFGTDILAYYKYVATHDLASEGRTITTLAQAAAAGITVSSITNENMVISPATYYKAESLGIYNIDALLPMLSKAANEGEISRSADNSSNNTNSGNTQSENTNEETTVVTPATPVTPEEYVDEISEEYARYDAFIANNKIGSIADISKCDYRGAIAQGNLSTAESFMEYVEQNNINHFTFYIVRDNSGKAAICLSNTNFAPKVSYEGYDAANVSTKENGEATLYDTVDVVIAEEENPATSRYLHRVVFTDEAGKSNVISAGHVGGDGYFETIDIAATIASDNLYGSENYYYGYNMGEHFDEDAFFIADSTGEIIYVSPTFTVEDIQNAEGQAGATNAEDAQTSTEAQNTEGTADTQSTDDTQSNGDESVN